MRDNRTKLCPSCGRWKPLHTFVVHRATKQIDKLCGACRHLGEPGRPTLAELEEMSRRAEAGLPVRANE